ncbi:MAG: DUF1820 family protein [Wenzhouxiangella sp.]|nr:DUF1820 family protein [Wenzhouxiangella sp.]MDR9453496.1 DUF1820 family protein [Wenzhouxiangella sp.]
MYKVIFHNKDQVYEMYCQRVSGAEFSYGFVELSDFVFESSHELVVDPTEERLKEEFADVESIAVPMHAIIRIEKVKKRGQSVIRDGHAGEKVTQLPLDKPRSKR